MVTGYLRIFLGIAYGALAFWLAGIASDRYYSPAQMPLGWDVLLIMVSASAGTLAVCGAIEVAMACPEPGDG